MSVIDDYLLGVEQPQRAELERIRKIIHAAVPDAEEVITYNMPGFKYRGRYLVSFAAFKDHMSLFPAADPIASYADKLKEYKTSKGTIQFTLEHPLPESLVNEIVAHNIARIEARG